MAENQEKSVFFTQSIWLFEFFEKLSKYANFSWLNTVSCKFCQKTTFYPKNIDLPNWLKIEKKGEFSLQINSSKDRIPIFIEKTPFSGFLNVYFFFNQNIWYIEVLKTFQTIVIFGGKTLLQRNMTILEFWLKFEQTVVLMI